MERKNNIKKIFKIIVIALLVTLVIFVFSFLYSIHFRLDYYLFSSVLKVSGYYYYDFDDFDEHKNNFENLINEVKYFVKKTPEFYDEYDQDFLAYSDGFNFSKKEETYPNNIVIYKPKSEDWNDIISCLYSFPDRGFGTIKVEEEYPKYVFFPCQEYSPRIIVYTNGETPYKLINEYWNKYEYVDVDKLAYGWYDIRPQGRK